MTLEEFAELVGRMRRAQKDYFGAKRQDVKFKALEESKRLERQVDERLAEIKSGQTELF